MASDNYFTDKNSDHKPPEVTQTKLNTDNFA